MRRNRSGALENSNDENTNSLNILSMDVPGFLNRLGISEHKKSIEKTKKAGRKRNQDLIKAYNNNLWSDVTLSIKHNTHTHKFNSHKIILIANSTYFRGIFSHQFKESAENHVNTSLSLPTPSLSL